MLAITRQVIMISYRLTGSDQNMQAVDGRSTHTVLDVNKRLVVQCRTLDSCDVASRAIVCRGVEVVVDVVVAGAVELCI